MADQMLFTELLTGNCGNKCKGMLKRKWVVIPVFITIAIIISLCVVVSVLHKKQNHHMDCVLRPTFKER